MPAGVTTGLRKRARTPGQKRDRRDAILEAAIAYARESGFDGVTMSGLSKRAGLAKGTLYLYFQTREEVFLALYLILSKQWSARIAAAVEPGQSDEAVVAALTQAVRDDSLFIELAARLSSIIEQNVPLDTLIDAKRRTFAIYLDLARHLEIVLRLKPGDGLRFGVAFMALMLGAAQLDTGGLATMEGLPDDVREIIGVAYFDAIFPESLRILLAGFDRT